MYDAPLISPENKDSSAETFAALPKISLSVIVPAAPSVGDSVAAVLNELDSNEVIYAELRLDPSDFGVPAPAAVEQALSVIKPHKVDARIILTAATTAANIDELASVAIANDAVAGFALVGDNIAEHYDTLKKLHDNFIPVVVEGDFANIEAGVKAGATRVAVGIDIIDDFSASIDGIEPGKTTSWIRDRHIAVETRPDNDVASGEVDELSEHPLPLLQQLGFTCTVGSTAMTKQFISLNETLGYGLEEFFDLTVAAIGNSFTTEEHRQYLIDTAILPAYEKLTDPETSKEADFDEETDTGGTTITLPQE